jgi:predicted Zn-dependent protease
VLNTIKYESIKIFSLVVLTGLLFACNSTSNKHDTAQHAQIPALNDSLFPNHLEYHIETPQEIFALDAQAVRFVHEVTANAATEKGKLNALVKAVFNKNQLSVNYNLRANTIANETFDSASANCLSLTILTYAMTQELDMDAEFQDVLIPEFWSIEDGNTLINKHVNLRVTPFHHKRSMLSRAPIIVDFDPQRGLRQFDVRILNKMQMVSYFYTNKAADFLIEDNESGAYAYLKAAIEVDPTNESAWLNLGVLMSQNKMYKQAMKYYEYALEIKPDYPTIYQNIAVIHKRKGEFNKADAKLAQLHKQRLKNPYYHIMMGDIAFEKDEVAEAVKHYKKAISINSRPHEFHFSLAKAYHALGDVKNTKRALIRAKRKANDLELERHYASKISVLLASL